MKPIPLRTFISQTVIEIFGAVEDLHTKIENGQVVPLTGQGNSGHLADVEWLQAGVTDVQIIHFEVTVLAESHKGSEAKLSIMAAVVGGGVKGDSNQKGAHTATLKFGIPVKLPGYPELREKAT